MSDTRRTSLMFLPNVAERLRECFSEAGLPESDWQAECAAHVTARCTICAEELAGEEFADWLLALGTEPGPGKRPLRFIRLARGCCGNAACNAGFYEFELHPHPRIDWGTVSFGALDAANEPEKVSTVKLATDAGREALVKQFSRRTVAAIAILTSLWMFHRWYNGDSIPLLRPAKTFTGKALPLE